MPPTAALPVSGPFRPRAGVPLGLEPDDERGAREPAPIAQGRRVEDAVDPLAGSAARRASSARTFSSVAASAGPSASTAMEPPAVHGIACHSETLPWAFTVRRPARRNSPGEVELHRGPREAVIGDDGD